MRPPVEKPIKSPTKKLSPQNDLPVVRLEKLGFDSSIQLMVKEAEKQGPGESCMVPTGPEKKGIVWEYKKTLLSGLEVSLNSFNTSNHLKLGTVGEIEKYGKNTNPCCDFAS